MNRGKRKALPLEQGDMLPEAERVPGEKSALVALTPETMMQLAIQKGGAEVAEVIERLTRLKVEMQDRDDRKELSRALAAARRDFPSITKNKQHIVTSTKGNYGFKWADLVNISDVVDPVLERHGLSYSWWSEMANGAAQLIVHCTLRHENGQSLESQFPVPTSSSSGMSDQQRFASAQMFGRRKSLEQVLGLVIDDMPGEAAADFDPTAVTEEQAATLAALADEVKADKARFLAIYGVADYSELPARNYGAAVKMLEGKRAKP